MRLTTQIAVVLAIALAGGAGWYALRSQGPAGSTAAAPAARPVPVVAAAAVRGDIAVTFDAIGTLAANEAVTITAKQSGLVRTISFDEGQTVQAGTVLVELDDTEARAELAVAEAERRTVVQELERSQTLLGRQAVAQARVDDLRVSLQAAEARVNAARARVHDLTIRAPFTGVTGLRRVSPGALVQPGTDVTTLDDIRVLRLAFTVPELALRSLKTGMRVAAASSVYAGQSFEGTVIAIDPRIDPVTRMVTVIAALPNEQRLLKPGMFMTVQLTLENRSNVVLIPEEALVPAGDRQYVFLVQDGRVERRPVGIGARRAGQVEVATGLRDGDLVVVRGTQKVRDGQPVKVEILGAAPAATSQT